MRALFRLKRGADPAEARALAASFAVPVLVGRTRGRDLVEQGNERVRPRASTP
ncbi:hypothetical protein ACU4GR_28245 [Methylobacterium oryzae CBMB20]